MEGKIAMAARRQVTNKLRDAYRGAAKQAKVRILDAVMATTGMGRSTVHPIALLHQAYGLSKLPALS